MNLMDYSLLAFFFSKKIFDGDFIPSRSPNGSMLLPNPPPPPPHRSPSIKVTENWWSKTGTDVQHTKVVCLNLSTKPALLINGQMGGWMHGWMDEKV